jgi:Alanine racemase, N-terminal domain
VNRVPVELQRRSCTFRPPTLQTLPVAVTANVVKIRARTRSTIMAVVKADGYGHGAVTVAKAAVAAGAGWLGTTGVGEASALSAERLSVPILTWLHPPGSTPRRRQPPGSMSRSGRWTSSARFSRTPRRRCGFIYMWTPGCPVAAAPAASGTN